MHLLETNLQELIINKAAFLGAVILSLLALVKAWKDWVIGESEKVKSKGESEVEKERLRVELEKAKLDAEVKLAQENSAGKTAIVEFGKRLETNVKDVEDLKREVHECAGENEKLHEIVQKLDEDFKDLLRDTLQYYQTQKGRR